MVRSVAPTYLRGVDLISKEVQVRINGCQTGGCIFKVLLQESLGLVGRQEGRQAGGRAGGEKQVSTGHQGAGGKSNRWMDSNRRRDCQVRTSYGLCSTVQRKVAGIEGIPLRDEGTNEDPIIYLHEAALTRLRSKSK